MKKILFCLFDKKASDLHREVFQKTENFYRYFPAECFIDETKAKEKFGREFMAENSILNTGKRDGLKVGDYQYELLSKLKTSNQRDKLISYNTFFNSTDKNEHFYTPLSLCIIHGDQDERLWNLADEWLDDESNPVDVDKICFNGSTALIEALTIYSRMRLNSTGCTEKQQKIRALTSKLIDKTTYLGETKKLLKIHPLQQAIDAYDIDFVKRIADKISDEEFQKLKISADEFSPLYYILNRRSPLLQGTENYKETMMLNPNNVNFKNLGVQGYTENEKKANYNRFLYGNDEFASFFREIMTPTIDNLHGLATKDEQISAHEPIIDYLISRTQDVDAFVRMNDTKVGCNALLYAAEINDVYACRKLIQAGADVTKVIGECLLPIGDSLANTPNSFIFRLIYWKSWDALKMFLTEFPDKAKLIMGKGKYDISPMEYFIILTEMLKLQAKTNKKQMEIMNIQKEITPLFAKAGGTL